MMNWHRRFPDSQGSSSAVQSLIKTERPTLHCLVIKLDDEAANTVLLLKLKQFD
jgi:hypothetical protein